MREAESTRVTPVEYELQLASLYVDAPSDAPHGVGLLLSAEVGGNREGIMTLDPNQCRVDAWGDRTGCTKKASRRIKVMTTRMRTLDPRGHGRVLHRVTSDAFQQEEANLIEYGALGLWYIVYQREGAGSWVLPLYDAKAFADDPASTVAVREGVPNAGGT